MLLVVRCSLGVAVCFCCVMVVVRCLVFVGCCSLSGACPVLAVGCCALCDV